MKHLLLTLLLTITTSLFSQNITVLQINADWNSNNTLSGLERLRNCTYKYGDLEKQPQQIKSSISSVPTIILFVDGKPKYQWVAGIDLRINATKEDIQAEIDKHIR